MGSISIRCRAGNSGIEKLDFYVMKAPSNLLSRYAIEKLWPQAFRGLREVTSVPAVNKITEVTEGVTEEVPEVPVVVGNTEVTATEVQATKYIIPAKR